MNEASPHSARQKLDSWATHELDELREAGLLRTRTEHDPSSGGGLNLASNDYLGLAQHPDVIAAARTAQERVGSGATASPLICGYAPVHAELERRLAEFKGYPAALVFTSGYAANVGILSALLSRNDTVFADRLAHASLLDGIRLSGAHLVRFRHNDPAHLRELLASAPPGGARMIVTESVFSMDGDLAPLADIADGADEFGATLMVDEAHATGLYGPRGAGRVSELHLSGRVPLCMGTLSKALGSAGGYVACSEPLRDLLVNRARSYIYSTALPPAAAGGALGALALLDANPGWGSEARRRADLFRAALRDKASKPRDRTVRSSPCQSATRNASSVLPNACAMKASGWAQFVPRRCPQARPDCDAPYRGRMIRPD